MQKAICIAQHLHLNSHKLEQNANNVELMSQVYPLFCVKIQWNSIITLKSPYYWILEKLFYTRKLRFQNVNGNELQGRSSSN